MPPTVSISFTQEELNIILSGLGELPAKQSIDLISKIRTAWFNYQKEQETPSEEQEPKFQRFQEEKEKA